MEIYNFLNQKYKEQQKTGISSIKFPDVMKSEHKNKTEQPKNYLCGHPIKTVIINTAEKTLYLYTQWMYDNPCNFCLDCWIKHRNKDKGV